MNKTVRDDAVWYQIEWSEPFGYDRITAGRILPDMPGILFLSEKKGSDHIPVFCFACWRDGVRSSMKNIMDEMFTPFPAMAARLKEKGFYYRYAVVDTSPHDMRDILFWLIRTYQPEYNSDSYSDSGRYVDVSVREMPMKKY